MTAPSQSEIDALAHFVEAVQEMRGSPFFIEEYHNLSLRWTQGEPAEQVRARVPDENVVRAVLVPFRRVWQQREPCNFRKVANTIKRYDPTARGLVDSFTFSDHAVNVRKFPFFTNIALAPSDAIDLWLNTRYLHTGQSPSHGKYGRTDFESFERQIGPVLFESYFLNCVWEAGISFFNLQRMCVVFLKECEVKGIRCSFTFRVQPTPNTVQGQIERKTPGFTPDADDRAHRIWRLKRRRRHGAISDFFQQLPCSDKELVEYLKASATFDDFLSDRRIQLNQVDDLNTLDKNRMLYYSGVGDADHTVWQNRKLRRGAFALREDGVFFFSGECVPVFRDQYQEFREAFLREPFV